MDTPQRLSSHVGCSYCSLTLNLKDRFNISPVDLVTVLVNVNSVTFSGSGLILMLVELVSYADVVNTTEFVADHVDAIIDSAYSQYRPQLVAVNVAVPEVVVDCVQVGSETPVFPVVVQV